MPDRAGRDRAGGWLHPGWSWTIRHGRVIGMGYGAFALLAGGALGVVPSLVTGDWKSGQTRDQLWVAIILAILAVLAIGLAETARRGRERMLARNGTAYIIREQARDWNHDEATRFRDGVRRQFARVIEVPGPGEVGRPWDWPLDDGARYWDEKVTELVRAFRVLNLDESRVGTITPNGVFIWAWWAVAAAFGMRATAADRSLDLDVWQRPGSGRAGIVNATTWDQRPHRFTAAAVAPPGGLLTSELTWPAELTLSRRGRGGRPAGSPADVSVLLVRYSRQPWGSPAPLPGSDAVSGDEPVSLHLHDAAGLTGAGTARTDVHELRCLPAGDQFAWAEFPALAAEAVSWVQRKAKELGARTFLLATVMPNEVALGLGILGGQESRRATWPSHLWPVVYQPGTRELVIPHLDLGTASLDTLGIDRRHR